MVRAVGNNNQVVVGDMHIVWLIKLTRFATVNAECPNESTRQVKNTDAIIFLITNKNLKLTKLFIQNRKKFKIIPSENRFIETPQGKFN